MKNIVPIAAALALTGLTDSAPARQPTRKLESRLSLTSPAFASGHPIPAKYTCSGEDHSPPLAWTDAPPGTKSFALIVDDPDAPDPDAPRMTWVHLVAYNLSASARELPAGGALPPGAAVGINDWKRMGWGGPCPPIGRHRYFFKLYALDTLLPDLGGPTKDALLAAMKGHVLEEAQLFGTYRKRASR